MEQITARCIVEILGAPKEYIEKKLKEHVDKLKEEDKLEVLTEKYEEPTEQEKLWAQFVELEIRFKDLREFLDFCFDSMPSTVEILSPDRMELDMAVFEDFINDFQGRLHQTDMMLKNLTTQKEVLDRNAVNMLNNFVVFACKEPKSIEDLSKLTGISHDELSKFVNGLVERGLLKKDGEVFVRNG